MKSRILMIEDDVSLSRMVVEYLSDSGLTVTARESARSGLRTLEQGKFDAVVLDVMLPDLDGFEVCRRIRAVSDVPILMLTARGDETDRIVGLELGADDYLPKPFNPRELLARLRAILRRGAPTPDGDSPTVWQFGLLVIDRYQRKVLVAGEERRLTSHQFDILCALAENAGRVLSRYTLMNKVRGMSMEAFDRSIDVHVSRIRAAIETDPKHPRRIITLRNAGYLFAQSQDD